ncbi:hypothetical protein [Pseudoprimorskyibacter insulae]|uniref:Uncharacterized protein n=1 Tax=Pseudoprimorskyibacter insulae TaxID=1695997 RepID=A0A2R8AYZ3_9RHOB|nr:hypothetical protein [Pseudoprimorskyibacter insulae]SPF81074.1 hypothetical protein PRI8871_02891 [Pseudoprimorskyibacter insulae]
MLRALLVWLALLAPSAALANSPYLSDPFDCQIDGDRHMAFLLGDGLFGPDPKAAVILSPEGRLLGYLQVGLLSYPMLGPDCAVYDADAKAVFVWEEDSAFDGPLMTGTSKEALAARWTYDPARQDAAPAFGFARAADQPGFAAILAAEVAQITQVVAFILCFSTLASACLVLVPGLPWRRRPWASTIGAAILVGVGGGAGLLVFVAYGLSGLSAALTVICIGAGAILGLGALALKRAAV